MKKMKLILFLMAMSLIVLHPIAYAASSAATTQATTPASSAAEQAAKIKELTEAFYTARETKDWGKCLEIAQECEKFGEDGKSTAEFIRFNVYVRSGNDQLVLKKLQGISSQFSTWVEHYFDAKAKIGEMDSEKLLKSLDGMLDVLDEPIYNLKLRKLQILVTANKSDEYKKYARSLMTTDKEDAYILNKIAWYIVCPDSESKAEKDVAQWRLGGHKMYNDPKMGNLAGANIPNGVPIYVYTLLKHSSAFRSKEMLALAKEAVDRAIKLTNRKKSDFIDTLGWVYFRMGEKAKAVATEREAAEKTGAEHYKAAADFFSKS